MKHLFRHPQPTPARVIRQSNPEKRPPQELPDTFPQSEHELKQCILENQQALQQTQQDISLNLHPARAESVTNLKPPTTRELMTETVPHRPDKSPNTTRGGIPIGGKIEGKTGSLSVNSLGLHFPANSNTRENPRFAVGGEVVIENKINKKAKITTALTGASISNTNLTDPSPVTVTGLRATHTFPNGTEVTAGHGSVNFDEHSANLEVKIPLNKKPKP